MDWKKLITDLGAAGYSQAAIGKAVGKSQPWVADIMSGRYSDVKWEDGQNLIALHRERCGAKK